MRNRTCLQGLRFHNRAYRIHRSAQSELSSSLSQSRPNLPKADSFQSDIYPDAPSSEPSLSASEFFHGKNAPANYINLADGSAASGHRPSASQSGMASPTVTQPTRSFTASMPSPAPAPVTPSPVTYTPSVTQEPGPATPRFERSDSTSFSAPSAPSRSQSTNTAEAVSEIA
jgi:coronin-1B/1C/6